MKASELRIGNWVELLTSNREVKTYQITSIGEDILGLDVCAFRINLFTPVKLTEEMLLKAGFVEGENKWFVKEYSTGFTATEKHEIVYNVDSRRCGIQDVGDGSTTAFTVNTEHLHQLQNLYHALTGEELEINL